MKEHSVRNKTADKPAGRTLFVLNVPPYVTEKVLSTVFSSCGDILNVHFTEKPSLQPETISVLPESKHFPSKKPLNKFKVGYVVFRTSEGLQNSLNLKKLPIYDEELLTGTDKWMQEYLDKIPHPVEFPKEIDEYMVLYDAEEKRKESLNNQTEEDDGWVTIGKKGKNAGFEQKESVVNKLEDKIEKGKKKKELVNFYTFQIRESKMQHIVSLRKKFEHDKQKIETMKKTRRFKPF